MIIGVIFAGMITGFGGGVAASLLGAPWWSLVAVSGFGLVAAALIGLRRYDPFDTLSTA